MATINKPLTQEEADIQAVNEAFTTGHPLDPEVAKRLDERMADFRERMIREHGLLDIAVPYTRQTREARS